MPPAAASAAPESVVLIHGLWMTPLSWEHWITRYEARGLRVLAPAWPGMDADVEALRSNPTPIAKLDTATIVAHYERIVRGLPRPPIIMGHSFGGAFVQILLDRGLGAAGVAIDSAPVRGVLGLPVSTVRSAWPILKNPRNRARAVGLTPTEFRYAFGNTVDDLESDNAYNRYHVPGAGRVLFEGALANFDPHSPFRVDFRRDDRAPLLFIAGGRDHVVPARVNRSNVEHYARARALTEYKEFAGRSHLTLGESGWEIVADYAIDWALRRARFASTAAPVALPATEQPFSRPLELTDRPGLAAE